MAIIEFMAAYWDSILLVICTCTVLGILYFRGQKKIVYKILYSLITEAEKQFGGGTGELKQAFVIEKVYNALPAVLKAVISAERLGEWIDDVLLGAKAKWTENLSVRGYIEGGDYNADTL